MPAFAEPPAPTVEWLADALAPLLPAGAAVERVRVVESRDLPLSRVVRLEVTYAGGQPAGFPCRLFLKQTRPQKDDGLHGPIHDREVEFYRQVAPKIGCPPLIRCLAAGASDDAPYLLLEDLTQSHTGVREGTPIPDEWVEAVVGALALVHARWWGDPRLGRTVGMPTTDADVERGLGRHREMVAAFLAAHRERLTPEQHMAYDRLLAPPASPWRRMAAERGLTVTHGDAHFGNFLFARDPACPEARILDWHLWYADYAMKDLAYMLVLHLPSERRHVMEERLLRRWHAAVSAAGVSDYTWEECRRDYALAVARTLMVAVVQHARGRPADDWWALVERAVKALTEHSND